MQNVNIVEAAGMIFTAWMVVSAVVGLLIGPLLRRSYALESGGPGPDGGGALGRHGPMIAAADRAP